MGRLQRGWPMDEEPPKPAIVPHGTVLPPPGPGVGHVPVALVGIVISDDVRV